MYVPFCPGYRDTMPAIYISHGGGPLPLMGDASHKALIEWLSKLGETIPTPKCILVISAHWEETDVTVLSGERPELLFDYYNFPKETYTYTYPAPGNPTIAATIRDLLGKAGFKCKENKTRGFDHGVFVPLMMMYPQADIPVLQLSLVRSLDPRLHINIGEALAALRKEGVLILGSGSSYHGRSEGRAGLIASRDFDAYLVDVCTNVKYNEEERKQRLCEWKKAPAAEECHPREEHLIPLMVVLGAGGGSVGKHVFSGLVMNTKMCGIRFD